MNKKVIKVLQLCRNALSSLTKNIYKTVMSDTLTKLKYPWLKIVRIFSEILSEFFLILTTFSEAEE